MHSMSIFGLIILSQPQLLQVLYAVILITHLKALIKVKSFNFDSFNGIQGRSTELKSQNFQDSLTIC